MAGSIASFRLVDVLRCFLAIEDHHSRSDLVGRLDLGEGIVRTMLDLLKEKSLVVSDQHGHTYSPKGKRVHATLRKYLDVRPLTFHEFYPTTEKVGVHLCLDSPITISYEMRDAAVKHNADGALIMVYNNGLRIPGNQKRHRSLEDHFQFTDNDVLVVGFAATKRDAENGALAAAAHVLPSVTEAFS